METMLELNMLNVCSSNKTFMHQSSSYCSFLGAFVSKVSSFDKFSAMFT